MNPHLADLIALLKLHPPHEEGEELIWVAIYDAIRDLIGGARELHGQVAVKSEAVEKLADELGTILCRKEGQTLEEAARFVVSELHDKARLWLNAGNVCRQLVEEKGKLEKVLAMQSETLDNVKTDRARLERELEESKRLAKDVTARLRAAEDEIAKQQNTFRERV